MKFKVQFDMTLDAVMIKSIEDFISSQHNDSFGTTFLSVVEGEEIELMVNGIGNEGLTFNAFYKRSDGQVLYLPDLGVSEFKKIEE